MPYKNIAVITGASSGLGKEFVRLLVNNPNIEEIWCVARSMDKLENLTKDFGDKIKTFSLDLSVNGGTEGIAKELKLQQPSVKYLINNAGYAKFCSYSELGAEESVNMINLNCGALVSMCVSCIPYMKDGGRIINIASQASFQPLPYMNIYSATKAFVRNYSRALNVELHDKGITVTAVCPGWMNTPFFERAETGAKKEVSRFYGITTPEKVAVKALHDADRGKDISVYGFYVKFCHLAAKLLPQRVMMKIWKRQQHF